MVLSHLLLIFGCGFFLIFTCYQIYRVIRKANTDDLSEAKGTVSPAFFYSLTMGMAPHKKETAYLHFPTYMAGIVYHFGSFYSILWIIVHITGISLPVWITRISFYFLLGTSLCGFGILLKRISIAKMRHISTPDDYFSNILVTGFQLLSACSLKNLSLIPYLYAITGFLFFYIPVGKLRHIVFFIIARFYLAVFYGKRGVWPHKRRKTWKI